MLFTAPNPPVGAEVTYYLKDGLRTKKQERQQRERDASRKNEAAPYPTTEELRAEAEEEAPAIIVTVSDASGKVVRRFDAPVTRGMHRVAWDLRGPAPVAAAPALAGPAGGGGRGPARPEGAAEGGGEEGGGGFFRGPT